MKVEKIAAKALTILKLKYGLPQTGFVAGGCLSNIMWEIVSGNKAVINDIDVFLLQETQNNDKIFEFKEVDINYLNAYGQITSSVDIKKSYTINESKSSGIFNEVKYSSDNNSPQIIIESFDINCTQIGYHIDDNKFYWTSDFEEFLKTGELKIVNLNTPAHTAIRIIKKKYELNAKLNECEFGICQFGITNNSMFIDKSRLRFKQRYADIFIKYEKDLKYFFSMDEDIELEKYLINKGVHDKIYFLNTPISNHYIKENSVDQFPGKNTITNSKEFLFYIRNVYQNRDLQSVWDKLYFFYNRPDYIDMSIDIDKINFLQSIAKSYPEVIKNLKGLKLSEQLKLVETVLNKITESYDYETAIAVLENVKLSPDKVFDEDECLLLGLSVRTKTKSVKQGSIDWL
jgi:hypothetical protein